MRDQQTNQRFDVIVIGGGQAGLAAGNEVERLGLHYVILDANARVGDAWRNRWDSLRLFTPARMSSLPGLPFPAPPTSYPGKDAVADYLATYVASKGLPVLNGLRVDDLRAADDGRGYTVRTGERSFHADQVVVATGAYDTPDLPRSQPIWIQRSASSIRATTGIRTNSRMARSWSSEGPTPVRRSPWTSSAVTGPS